MRGRPRELLLVVLVDELRDHVAIEPVAEPGFEAGHVGVPWALRPGRVLDPAEADGVEPPGHVSAEGECVLGLGVAARHLEIADGRRLPRVPRALAADLEVARQHFEVRHAEPLVIVGCGLAGRQRRIERVLEVGTVRRRDADSQARSGREPHASQERLAAVVVLRCDAPSRRAHDHPRRVLQRPRAAGDRDTHVPVGVVDERHAEAAVGVADAVLARSRLRQQRVGVGRHRVPHQRRVVLVHERRAHQRVAVRVRARRVRADRPRDLAREEVQVALRVRREGGVGAFDVEPARVAQHDLAEDLEPLAHLPVREETHAVGVERRIAAREQVEVVGLAALGQRHVEQPAPLDLGVLQRARRDRRERQQPRHDRPPRAERGPAGAQARARAAHAASSICAPASAGIQSVTVVPTPSRLSISSRPPWASAMPRAIGIPRPRPAELNSSVLEE